MNPGLWLMPNQAKTVSVTALIPLEEIPEIAFDPIINGGNFRVRIESSFELVGFSLVRTAAASGSITDTVRKRLSR